MHGEIRLLIIDELVELEKGPVDIQDFKIIVGRFRRIYGTYLELIKEN